ncbi:hypothetical protein SAZ10_00440 [Mesorhizobium sp. BAC0120]|uniref:hypothetical protein n=1 Tax=Mesorhizobium sp. BAC0120 TaxID=3090670 RepID=UPI00298C4F7C|nr:hypothetical protein [Mesorhizobium sp. BAC0120]MDW6020223.1 hypothetical protein [Mesorhizobium sp. BAC0120]
MHVIRSLSVTKRMKESGDKMTEASQERAIGRIEGKLDLIIAEQAAAAEARKQTYEKLDTLNRKVDATDTKVQSIDQRLEKVEEPVAEFSRWRERGIGAIMLVSFVAASIGGLLVAFGKKIWVAIMGT